MMPQQRLECCDYLENQYNLQLWHLISYAEHRCDYLENQYNLQL